MFIRSQRRDIQATEIFMGCWRQEVVTRIAEPSRADTVTLWQGRLWPGRPTDTNQKKIFHCSLQKDRSICQAQIFSATLSYRNYHSVNSTVLDYKGPQRQISGPFEAEDSVVNYCECQRVSLVVSGVSWVIYACLDLHQITPAPPSCFPEMCQEKSESVVSSNMSYTLHMTIGTGAPNYKLPTSRSVSPDPL